MRNRKCVLGLAACALLLLGGSVLARPCPSDLNSDGVVGVRDFLLVLAEFGQGRGSIADISGDGVVDTVDFLRVLADWGQCR